MIVVLFSLHFISTVYLLTEYVLYCMPGIASMQLATTYRTAGQLESGMPGMMESGIWNARMQQEVPQEWWCNNVYCTVVD